MKLHNDFHWMIYLVMAVHESEISFFDYDTIMDKLNLYYDQEEPISIIVKPFARRYAPESLYLKSSSHYINAVPMLITNPINTIYRFDFEDGIFFTFDFTTLSGYYVENPLTGINYFSVDSEEREILKFERNFIT